jgi:hypothetical protein
MRTGGKPRRANDHDPPMIVGNIAATWRERADRSPGDDVVAHKAGALPAACSAATWNVYALAAED